MRVNDNSELSREILHRQKFSFYYPDGTSSNGSDPLPCLADGFYIMVAEGMLRTGTYPGDSVIYDIERELRVFRDVFRKLIFPDDDRYYDEIKRLPLWITMGGMSSDFCASKASFEKMYRLLDAPSSYNAHMYIADVSYLINSIGNLIIGMEANFVDYFRLLSQTSPSGCTADGTYVVRGQHAELVISILGSYYSRLYSILDLFTKAAYEFENPRMRFEKYPRLNCSGILYNNKQRLRINNRRGTIFDKDDQIIAIESIRNEIIHNGMWEDIARVYVTIKEHVPVERYVLFPDMEKGRFVAYGNRHHFFSEGIKVNSILPQLHISFLSRLAKSIREVYSQNVEC